MRDLLLRSRRATVIWQLADADARRAPGVTTMSNLNSIATAVSQCVASRGGRAHWQAVLHRWVRDRRARRDKKGVCPPLPIPLDLDDHLTVADQYAVLGAIHDAARPDDRIDPWARDDEHRVTLSPDLEIEMQAHPATGYWGLIFNAGQLADIEMSVAEKMLDAVKRDLRDAVDLRLDQAMFPARYYSRWSRNGIMADRLKKAGVRNRIRWEPGAGNKHNHYHVADVMDAWPEYFGDKFEWPHLQA